MEVLTYTLWKVSTFIIFHHQESINTVVLYDKFLYLYGRTFFVAIGLIFFDYLFNNHYYLIKLMFYVLIN